MLQEVQRLRPPRPSLVARLAKPEPPTAETPKAEPPATAEARPRPAPVVKAAPQPLQVPAPAERAPGAEPPKPRPAAQPAAVAPAAPTPAPPSPAPQPAQVSIGPDAGTLAQFRLELMDLARRYKRYPRIAVENNWQGRVELSIAIAENGALSAITVKKGAGRAVLDEEAQAMIRAAKSKATIPPALRGKAFTLEIPVDFLLKDEEK